MNDILVSDILYGSYIRYDRMYEMTKYAFYGRSDSNNVNIFIDAYSIIRSLFKRGSALKVDDSFSIASCIINLAIHVRAYFETRHNVSSKVYIIYGGARNNQSILMYQPGYNEKNILMEDSNAFLKNLVKDNMEVVQLISQYLYDIFCVVNYNQEFITLSSHIIDRELKANTNNSVITPNIIYSKDQLSYQLVAFKPYTFLYRPKKSHANDNSWVVTKSTLFNAYRGGELKMKTTSYTSLDPKMISLFQAISGVRDRSIECILNARSSILLLEKLVNDGILINGYNESILYRSDVINNIQHKSINPEDIKNRFLSIDLNFQSNNHLNILDCTDSMKSIVNLYNPQEVRSINDQYFRKYPLDLNRV